MGNLINYCIACHSPMKGRTDKKFCNDNCRNNYHNSRNSFRNNLLRRINAILSRNRWALETLQAGRRRAGLYARQQLQEIGFDFRYYTHTQLQETGELLYCCYDYGYSLSPDGTTIRVCQVNT